MLYRSMKLMVAFLSLVALSSVVSAQIFQQNPSLQPFHNQRGRSAVNQNPQYNPAQGPAGPGSLTVPQIMAVKRPLPRRPVQPVFDLSDIDMSANDVVLDTRKQMRALAVELTAARRAGNHRRAMTIFRRMERTRQELLRHLRTVLPVKKEYAPVPAARPVNNAPIPSPATGEKPVLPMPVLPGGSEGK